MMPFPAFLDSSTNEKVRLRSSDGGHPSLFFLGYSFLIETWHAIRSFPRSGRRRMVEAAGVECRRSQFA